jgi:hypothetical protein
MRKKPTYPDQEERLRRALERLCDDDPVCKLCPESDPRCLERHHIAGRQFGDAIVIVCRNCHRKLSDAQYDHPQRLNQAPPEDMERLGHFLIGLGDFFSLLAAALRDIGRYIVEQAKALASKCTPAEGVAS